MVGGGEGGVTAQADLNPPLSNHRRTVSASFTQHFQSTGNGVMIEMS